MKEKNTTVNLNVKNDSILTRIKKSLFDKELYNQRSIVFKITATAIFLGITIGLSLIEIFYVPMPWGATFGVRLFDTLVLIYSISIVGLGFSLLEGIALPWIHNLIDGHHTWIEMFFFMVSNILVIFITWFIYYIVFNAYYKSRVPENVEDHDIHEYHVVKKPHDHHHRIGTIGLTKKITAFSIIVPICALIEAWAVLLVAKILLSTGHQSFDVDEGKSGLNGIFTSWQHTLTFLAIFFGIFMAKYILNTTLFILLERRTRSLIDRYGIYA
ncbi:hypothetical protein P344_05400 [Spiroplasma mirum ATCC 29335]|uniref:Transmembrane protein n=1 Tax=Spiroplasma mirum ATCC 29335 TaxID=838561 RepID=W0GRW7_9MOLU|nr:MULTISPECIES: hypothetical protein [Spiroplasma]AHF61296.1 putative transmembrane protein [Spiroplasma mirum ATCC 29335]AHI58401.1 hypothetical protein P344_05400 [Spiroplasma mirum ATCC 29335]AKM53351.1 hypothetical protein SATRI_v1c09720 [Spiroplasma atrichopogonis]